MVNIGRIIYGYCNGFFGRDSYDDKVIEAEGFDWIVVREQNSKRRPDFCSFDSPDEKQTLIEQWANVPADD